MAATIQHKPVLLPPQSAAEDEDIALAALITNSLRFDQVKYLIPFAHSTPLISLPFDSLFLFYAAVVQRGYFWSLGYL